MLFLFFIFSPSLNPPSPFEQLKLGAYQNYQNPQAHLDLARAYEVTGDLENARREILIGLSFEPNNKELQEGLTKIESLLRQPEEVKEEIGKWEKIVRDFPGYRDAYLELTALYYQLYQNGKARENLERALELDPNFGPAKEMEKMLRD